MELPSKRDTVLYARVTKQNKSFLEKFAGKSEVSESALIDHIITWFKSKNASNKRKPK